MITGSAATSSNVAVPMVAKAYAEVLPLNVIAIRQSLAVMIERRRTASHSSINSQCADSMGGNCC